MASSERFSCFAFLFLLPLVQKVCSANNDVTVAGIPREEGETHSDAFSCKGKLGPHCDGCYILRICADSELKTINCISDAKLKFCNRNKCSNSPPGDKQCPTETAILCTSEGFFPHPSNCSQYYYCEELDANPLRYDCPVGYVYSARNFGCIRRKTARDCVVLNCASIPIGNAVIYAAHSAYYGVCVSPKNAFVFKCNDDVNEEYVMSSGKCELKCLSEGRTADRLDCRKYYQCERKGGKLVARRLECPPKYGFDEQKSVCSKYTDQCLTEIEMGPDS